MQTPIDFNTVMAHKIFGASADLLLFIVPFFFFDALTNGEELAWRGYVLPRLQAKHSALVVSLILGVIWGFWHFPRYLAPGNTAPFSWSMLKVLADAILYTWLYNNTGGSLLLVTILHAAGNTAGAFLPMANTMSGENLGTLLVVIALEFVIAAIVTIYAGSERLSRTEPKQMLMDSALSRPQNQIPTGGSSELAQDLLAEIRTAIIFPVSPIHHSCHFLQFGFSCCSWGTMGRTGVDWLCPAEIARAFCQSEILRIDCCIDARHLSRILSLAFTRKWNAEMIRRFHFQHRVPTDRSVDLRPQ